MVLVPRIAVLLGILFEKTNVAFMVSLAFALAASGNFPVLILSLLWKGCTTRGVVAGGTAGVVLALVLTILSPAIWVNIVGQETAIFPYSSPAIFSMPIAFFTIWLVSLLDGSPRAEIDRAGYSTSASGRKPDRRDRGVTALTQAALSVRPPPPAAFRAPASASARPSARTARTGC